MRHGSLFSGIGGFDLASEWMGWTNVFHCEINEFCRKVLKQHFPDAATYTDITTTDFTQWQGRCDIVTGGFPCQPYSNAGKRKGKADDRHLWPQMLRAIKQIQPAWVVGENVPGLLNWKRGMVLAEIYADLEAAGFEVFPPVILPACGVGSNHRRERLWVIANSKSINGRQKNDYRAGSIRETQAQPGGLYRPQTWAYRNDRNSIKSAILRKHDGVSGKLDEHRTAALGNAIVPQVAYEIFKAIESINSLEKSHMAVR